MMEGLARLFGGAAIAAGVFALVNSQPFLGIGCIFLGFITLLFTM